MDSYSRMVQFLKVLLPLAAIVLLSTVFLLSRGIETDVTGPFSERDMDDRLKGQQITRPVYTGTTRKGDEIQVSASIARPGGAQAPTEASDFKGTIRFQNGRVMTLDSDLGSVRPDRGMATFTGNVVMTTADGMRLTTDVLNTALDEIKGDAPGTVHGTGPIGELTAGAMRFGAEKEDGPVHILFTDGVKLIYHPEKPER
ncbi:hypothetical protein AVO45_08080 [Ruegeria marisrubri]|uniref:LPS export ABC transporter periplasmic protein LptC n=1 Tax=Ruegeria marisrubri TaxID=1685379 RepID=A0A0X3TS98_9RHOB|nr:hypothetical protein [Ruegeria marisrubri]KUJ77921.1 hypothetical protein AVO45_08080 [Ruegeria marisrubri]